MNVLLCNERLLFRFGVDRALLILGRGLAARGHRVSIMANRFDQAVTESFATRVIRAPDADGDYLNVNEFTADWIAGNAASLFGDADVPEVVVIGGWPFFCSIPVFKQLGCATVFMDCGAVPLQGFEGGSRIVQEKLRLLRRRYLPGVTRIVPISRFIGDTQSRPDGAGAEVTPVLLGADHMSMAIWKKHLIGCDPRSDQRADALERLIGQRPLILNLGRWEPGCYKNSEAVYRIVDLLRQANREFVVAILADANSVVIPDCYRDQVIPIGHPDDEDLQRWMERSKIGISVSRWEGFNLPLVEMQWLDKPVLAFDVGAHHEVILHPWFLCGDEDEMAAKAGALIAGNEPVRDKLAQERERFRDAFRWDRVIGEYEAVLMKLAQATKPRRPRLIIDVSNAARDEANSGVVRVTRRLARELQRYSDPTFALWDAEAGMYVYPNDREYALLSAFNGPIIDDSMARSPLGTRRPVLSEARPADRAPGWLLLTETILETHGTVIRRFARRHGLRIGAIFYDAIAVLRPDLVKDALIRDNHASYMEGLSECELVLPISEYSADCLKQFWDGRAIIATNVITVQLPGEFAGSDRCHELPANVTTTVSILCVSTLEPRKNHVRLVDAINRFARDRQDLQWTLTLVGNRYAGSDDIAQRIKDECERNPRIRWLGIVDDATLHRAYRNCTFTVYASEIEGFGMPILESLWHGKPCICHHRGVMAELASGGGCLTVDVTDPDAFAGAVEALAADNDLRFRLTAEAIRRPIKTWDAYAAEIMRSIMKSELGGARPLADEAAARSAVGTPLDPLPNIPELLYPGCLTSDWQMNDSERLGMTAVLHRLKPTCAIEVGTYKGGSLSLLAQYANAVFSIDIDPTIPASFAQFENVSFLTGPSGNVLPTLLQELDSADLPVDFVLIDGDHSAAGVQRDIEIMLDYVPKKLLVLMLHDGFNPACRQGMLAANWGRSPHVQWVDLDFIPGRLVEHGGGGDGQMWGGLAMALLAPKRRSGELIIGASAQRAYSEIKERHYA